jgi:hypothetical protein
MSPSIPNRIVTLMPSLSFDPPLLSLIFFSEGLNLLFLSFFEFFFKAGPFFDRELRLKVRTEVKVPVLA